MILSKKDLRVEKKKQGLEGIVRDRILNTLNDNQADLTAIVGDWSPWDDTLAFVQGNNDEYIGSNLETITFLNLGINSWSSTTSPESMSIANGLIYKRLKKSLSLNDRVFGS